MIDPIEQLAQQHIVLASSAIEAELRDPLHGPVLGIWRRWRKNAIKSLAELATLNVHVPAERQAIVTHQNEVKRYAEYAGNLVQIFHEGVAIDKALTDEERRDLIQLIKGMPEEERALINTGEEDASDMPID